MKILIVDDRRENLIALEAILGSPDYQLYSASSGEEALRCVLKEDFAVILLDVQMPGMDGFETAKLIRARKRNKDTPIIFITAIYQSYENIVQGYSLGAIDYLFKPFNPETLRFKIEAFVKMQLHRKHIGKQNELLTLRAIELEIVNESLTQTTSDLRKAEALARVIGETSTDTVITLNAEGVIINLNPAITGMFGYQYEEILGQHVSRLFPDDSLRLLNPDNDQALKNRSKILDAVARRKDGAVFPVEVQIGGTSIEGQMIVVWSVRDITEKIQLELERRDRYNTLQKLVQERTNELFLANQRLRGEIQKRSEIAEQLRETSLSLTNILESITDAFFSLNRQWQFIFVNEEAERFLQKSREELIGQTIWELFPDLYRNYYPIYQKSMKMKEAVHFEISGCYSEVPYEVYVFPSNEGLSVYYRDISERKLFEKEMARLDRLNLVGQMAAGIGHEIRNPMTTVRGFLQLLGEKEEFNQSKDYFELMIEELDRANSIITEFLSLAKNKVLNFRTMSLNSLIESIFPLIQADAMLGDKEIRLALQETKLVPIDEKEIRQLILNLVRNGLEAMTQGGTLTIKTFMDGGRVVLAVSDEGFGIKAEDLEKIGTPFFTTKETGTGLGLATCYSIASRHNAKIRIDSAPSGTTFFVRFKLH